MPDEGNNLATLPDEGNGLNVELPAAHCRDSLPIDSRNCRQWDTCRTHLRTLSVERTRSELGISNCHHVASALACFWLADRQSNHVRKLCAKEKMRRTVRTGRDARTTTDARGVVEGSLGLARRRRHLVSVRRGSGVDRVPRARLDNVVQAIPRDYEIALDGKRFGTEWLKAHGLAIFEGCEALVTRGHVGLRSMGNAVDGNATHSANTLATV